MKLGEHLQLREELLKDSFKFWDKIYLKHNENPIASTEIKKTTERNFNIIYYLNNNYY